MAKLFLTNINMNGNEIDNMVMQPLATAPANPTVGRIYYDTTDSMLKTYDGESWSSVGAVISVNGKAGVVVLTQDDVGDGSTYVRTHNDLTDALEALINGALQKTGGTMSGAIAMGSNKITGLANGSAATDAAAYGQIPTATSTTPKMDGTAAVGTETKWAKGDHVHPSDTSKQAKITASGILKGNGSGTITAAVAGTDYGTYSKPSGGIPESDLDEDVQELIDGALQTTGGTMSGAIAMGSNKITGLSNGSAATDAAAFGQIPTATTTTPKMDGTAAVGSETKWAKGDHVHPTDTSRQAKITASGILKGNGSGTITAATAGTDYGTYSKPTGGIPETDLDSDTQALIDGALQKTGGTMSGAIAMGSNKITGIANGTASTDAAAFGQIPTAYTSNPAMDGTASPGNSGNWARGNHVHPTDTSRMAANLKGAANGVAELDSTGKVPSSQLPSFVDDVIEGYYYNSKFWKESSHTTEIPGETGKIYVDMSTNKTYRYSGSAFVEISASLALGETSSTAYRGDRGKTAYDHSQLTSGNPHNVTKANVGLGNVDNTSDATKKTNFTGAVASGNTGFPTGGAVYTAINDAVSASIKTATGTIGTNATSASVSFSGTFINAYATINGSVCVVDITPGSSSVTFGVAAKPSSAVTCVVVYA